MALWRDATAGALGPGQGDYDPYGDLSSLVRQIAPGIGAASQVALQPQLQRPDDSFAAYMADPLARSDADIQQRAAAGPPSAGQSLSDLGNMVLPYLAGAAPGGSLSSGIRAYHGSPYDFNAFDVSKIGTGEGAQAYGHGLYFAESEPVARSYRDALSSNTGLSDPANDVIKYWVQQGGGDKARGAELYRQFAQDSGITETEREQFARHIEQQPGHMYEVDINADPQSFLPWDKPASQWPNQPLSAVQDLAASQGMRLGDVTGERLYQQLATSISDFGRHTGGDQQAASEALGQAGIPGIRYLDQQSRNAGGWHITPADQTVSGKWMVKSNDYNSQGMHFDTEAEAQKALQAKIGGQTSNYVVFDPKIIDILRKYAVPGLISGGGAAGIANAGSQ
jgi:hypothetical protein